MSEYNDVQELLAKLKRNEEKMTKEQKKQYAAQLKSYKHRIAELANKIGGEFIVSGCRIFNEDVNEELMSGLYQICEHEKKGGSYKAASRILWKTYSIDEFLEILCPVHDRIWYEWYGPYWLSKVVFDEERQVYTTPLLPGMHWEKNQWYSDDPDKLQVTIMLPPTKELLDKVAVEDMEKTRDFVAKKLREVG